MKAAIQILYKRTGVYLARTLSTPSKRRNISSYWTGWKLLLTVNHNAHGRIIAYFPVGSDYVTNNSIKTTYIKKAPEKGLLPKNH
jgi:hypothetical protein